MVWKSCSEASRVLGGKNSNENVVGCAAKMSTMCTVGSYLKLGKKQDPRSTKQENRESRREKLDAGEDFVARLGHRDRVLEVGGEPLVLGDDRPVVGQSLHVVGPFVHHRLDRDHVAGLEDDLVAGDFLADEVGH